MHGHCRRALPPAGRVALANKPTHFLSTVQSGITVSRSALGEATLSEQVAKSLSRIAWLHPYADRLAFWIAVTGIAVFSQSSDATDGRPFSYDAGLKVKARGRRAWPEQKAVRDIVIFLLSHGIGTSRAVRILKTYGHEAIQVMTEDPSALQTWGEVVAAA